MKRWEIYWANVPFEDQPAVGKMRPVIVCADKQVYVLTIKVTHHEARECSPYDYQLIYWKEAGLSQESAVRVDKISKLVPEDFGEYIGMVQPADALEIQKIMQAYRSRK